MSDSKHSGRRLSRPATVLAAAAVFAALAGTATAASDLISGSQIKKGTITAKQIKNKSISANKLNPAAVKQLKGNVGPKGEAGPKGETGPRGPAGIVAPLYGEANPTVNIADGDEETVITLAVPNAGKFLITAKTQLFSTEADGRVDCFLLAGGEEVDSTQWTAGAAASRQPVTMLALATATPADPIVLGCGATDSGGSASETHVSAIPVS